MHTKKDEEFVARMIVESLSQQLYSLPPSIFLDAEFGNCNPRIVMALQAAHEVFLGHVTVDDMQELAEQVEEEIRSGLAELDK